MELNLAEGEIPSLDETDRAPIDLDKLFGSSQDDTSALLKKIFGADSVSMEINENVQEFDR
jgi:hypothetical protein